jgi:hypothetical protein
MKRPLLGLGLLVGLACDPNLGVAPGAPVLTKFTIVEPSGAATDITPDTADCDPDADAGADAGVAAGQACDPASAPVCRLGTTFCHCAAKAMDDPSIDPTDPTTGGTVACSYDPGSTVIARFDRIIDGQPFDVDGDQAMGIATLTLMPPPVGAPPEVLAEYISNGTDPSSTFFGYTNTGPRISITASPAFPDNSDAVLALDPSKVRAKDGTTPFASSGAIRDGRLSFRTGATPPAADGGVPEAGGGGDDGGAGPDGGGGEQDGGAAEGGAQ